MLNLVNALLGFAMGTIVTILFFTAPPSFLTIAPATIWWVCLVTTMYAQAQAKQSEKS